MQTQGRRQQFRRKKGGHQGGHQGGHRGHGHGQPDSLLEQPSPEASSTVPCPSCGHPVDPKRLHFHMVRFHGASLRSKMVPPGQ